MGTTYKGGAAHFHSIGQNVLITSTSYSYNNGYFGENSVHGGNRTRTIFSIDNLATAKDFYDKIAYGGKEAIVSDNLRITRMADGSVVSMRIVSHSDGTPVVDINIKYSADSGGVKSQKIHFVRED